MYVLLTVMNPLPVLLYSMRALLTVAGDARVGVHDLVPHTRLAHFQLATGLAASLALADLTLADHALTLADHGRETSGLPGAACRETGLLWRGARGRCEN